MPYLILRKELIMVLSNKLWKENSDLASLSLNTPFVKGIKDGTLPIESFQLYIAQDYYFLESFAHAYGLAISKCNDRNSIQKLSELLMGVSEELVMHENYAKSWGIDISKNTLREETKAYTDFLEQVAKEEILIAILSAMTPCMKLYSWLGKELSIITKNNPYQNWVLTYSDDNFEKLAKTLESLIDKHHTKNNLEKVHYLYRRAMELELKFFNAYSNF